MLVDVVVLRAAGKKLPRNALLPPFRGELSLAVEYATPPFRPDLRARMPIANLAADVFLRLYDVRLRKIDGMSLVLVGGEEGPSDWLPQAWWCRLVEPQRVSVSAP